MLFALIGTYFVFNSKAATTDGAANIWVDTNGGSCTWSSTPVAWNDSQACSTFQDAYDKVQDGNKILVKSGNYLEQSVGNGTKNVIIEAATNSRPIISGESSFAADNLTIRGMQFNGTGPGVHGVVSSTGARQIIDNILVDANNNKILAMGVNGDGTQLINSEIRNVVDEKGILVSDGTGIKFDNIYVHDVTMSSAGAAADVHNECIYAIVVPSFSLKNSKFWNCSVMDVYFTYGFWWNPLPPDYGNVTLENNVFDTSRRPNSERYHYYGVVVAGTGAMRGTGCFAPVTGWKVRYNAFMNTMIFSENESPCTTTRPVSGNQFVGNIGGYDCLGGDTIHKYNVGTACPGGSNNKNISPNGYDGIAPDPTWYVDPLNNNFHSTSNSPAIDAGDPSDYPSKDADGNTRYQGSAPDAGPYEYQSGATSGPSANLWIDPDGGNCTRSATPASYSDATACGSLQNAYNAANGGDIIRIVGGNYTGQTISGSKSSLVSMIVDTGTMALSGGLSVSASNISIKGPGTAYSMTLGNLTSTPASTNITIDGWTFDKKGGTGAAGYLSSIDGATIKNSTFMNNLNESMVFTDGGPGAGMKNITWDNNVFHDALTDAAGEAAAVHTECVYGGAGSNITFRNNHFYKCRTMDLFVTTANHDTMMPKNYTLENNIFECSLRPDGTCHAYGLVFVDGWNSLDGALVRNNWLAQDISLPSAASGSISYFYSNAINGVLDCSPSSSLVVRAYNVTTGAACSGTGNKQVTSLMTDSNFRPISGSPLINAGDSTNSTTTDKSGATRNGLPDAGAYEYGGTGGVTTCSTKQGDANGDNAVNIQDISKILVLYGQSSSTDCADVTKDGSINIQDISLVLSKYGT